MKLKQTLIGTLIGLLSLTGLVAAESENNRPNIVILLADDMGTVGLGCYGSPNKGASPNIDRLAEQGMRFRNMFVSAATCAPVRAELYTGYMPERNGCNRNHCATTKASKSMVHYLEELGYRVGLAGKSHFSPKSVYPFQDVKGLQGKATFKNSGPDDWEPSRTFMASNEEQPFCLVVGSIHPHAPWDSGDASQWEKKDIVLPKSFVDTPVTRDKFRHFLAEVKMFDQQVGAVEKLLRELEIEENTVIIILGENGIGMPGGKWSTFDLGLRSACIIKWPGGESGTTDAIAHYCDILPTLIEGAGGEGIEDLDGRSLLPLLQGKTNTHREFAYGLHNSRNNPHKKDPHFSIRTVTDGHYKLIVNQTPENMYATLNVNGPDYGQRNRNSSCTDIYLSWLAAGKKDPALKPFTQRIRYYPEVQLFDLQRDSGELNNLADYPEYHAKVQTLKMSLSGWMQQQGDDGNRKGEGIKLSDMPFGQEGGNAN